MTEAETGTRRPRTDARRNRTRILEVAEEFFAEAGITPDMATADICDKLIATFTGDFEFSGLTCPIGEVMTWSETGEVSKDPKGMVIVDGVYQPLD